MSVSPWIISDGDVFKVGYAEIMRSGKELIVSDLYSNKRFKIDREASVELIPTSPVNTPSKLTNVLYLKFKSPIVSTGGYEYWVHVPYDLVVLVDETPIAVVSPFKVKFTLHGSIIDGLICRYYESDVYDSLKEAQLSTFEGLMKVVIPGSEATIMYEYTIIDIESLDIYRESRELKVYYEAIMLSPNPYKPFARALGEPSKRRGVEKVSVPWSLNLIVTSLKGVEYGYYGPS